MFAEELNEYYLLGMSIKDIQTEIEYLEAQLCASPKLDKITASGSSGKNTVEEQYIKILTKKDELQRSKSELEEKKERIENYVDGITDRLIRSIAIKRVKEKKRFREIADELGGNNTEDSVKKMYYRHVLGIKDKSSH